MSTIAPDLLRHATLESKVAFVLYVDGRLGDGKSAGEIWRDAYVQGYLAGFELRPVRDLVADINTLLKEERRAKHRPRTDTATPARRKSDAEDAALAADLEAEAGRARDRDRARRALAHQHSDEVKP